LPTASAYEVGKDVKVPIPKFHELFWFQPQQWTVPRVPLFATARAHVKRFPVATLDTVVFASEVEATATMVGVPTVAVDPVPVAP